MTKSSWIVIADRQTKREMSPTRWRDDLFKAAGSRGGWKPFWGNWRSAGPAADVRRLIWWRILDRINNATADCTPQLKQNLSDILNATVKLKQTQQFQKHCSNSNKGYCSKFFEIEREWVKFWVVKTKGTFSARIKFRWNMHVTVAV